MLSKREKGLRQRAEIIGNLRSVLCQQLETMILQTELNARRGGLRELHHRLELITQGVLYPAIVISDVVNPSKKGPRGSGKETLLLWVPCARCGGSSCLPKEG